MRHAVLLTVWLLTLGCPRAEPQGNTAPPARKVDAAASSATPAPVPATAQDSFVPSDEFAERRAEREALASALAADGISDPRVLAAMRRVPRHAFVPEAVRSEAYRNRPLPIGHGQTISQPWVVAAMTQAARPRSTDKCLEIGTGSGYQAAVLAEVCSKVYSIEYLEPLAAFAESNLRRLGYGPDRVELRHGDGYRSWPEAHPFDVVLVTAAPDHVPEPLLQGLAVGGRLVIPVGPQNDAQQLELWTRKRPGTGKDAFEHEVIAGVRFVPFLGEGAR